MTDDAELTASEKETIIGLRASGNRYSVIAEEMDLDVETVRRVVDSYSVSKNPGVRVEYPDVEAQSLIAQVNAARVADDPKNEKAYDGSDNPPKRELTARERDILVRLIDDILNHKRNNPPIFKEFGGGEGENLYPLPYWDFPPVPIRIGEGDLFHVLWKIREAIDPRDS